LAKRSGIMLCAPLEERRLPGTGWVNSWSDWPVLVQPKLDGERCRAKNTFSINGEGGWVLLSSEMNIFSSVPHINRAIDKQVHTTNELDGELYVHGMPFADIHSIVSRTKNLHPRFNDMEYHIFDIVNGDPQHKRIQQLATLQLKPPLIHVPTYIANSFDEIMEYYDTILALGYEGIIVRNIDNTYIRRRSLQVMKFKPKKSDYYTIVGWKEERSKEKVPKDNLGSLKLMGSDGTIFDAGPGLGVTDDKRREWWRMRDELHGKLCLIQYQSIRPSGKPNFGLFMDVLEPEPEEANFLLNKH